MIDHSLLASDGLETGGVLLGATTAQQVDVRHAGGPGPGARRTANTFDRDLQFAQELASEMWDLDQSQWIGEWHTHPLGPLCPSDRDLASYMTHLRDDELNFSLFVSIILGTPTHQGIPVTAWAVTPQRLLPGEIIVLGEDGIRDR